MGWRLCAALLLVITACTKSNPAKFCSDGTCANPAFPFCDLTGAVSGEPGICITASCTANALVECRGDIEVRCNPDGTNYNLVTCDRGCDEAADGCRLCDPGETTCTNGKVATCDATGAVVASQSCPLGCYEDEPRCREIDPSNGLGTYVDMVSSPPPVSFIDARIVTTTGEVTDVNGSLTVPSFMIAANGGAPAIRVFVVASAEIQRLEVAGTAGNNAGPAFALISVGDISITGLLKVLPGVGHPACFGGSGRYRTACNHVASGGGGGGNATNGAKGGTVSAGEVVAGGTPGIASGTPTLVPLRGGCGGGGVPDSSGVDYTSASYGGGAVQLTSRTRIRVDGIIDVTGADGGAEYYAQTQEVLAPGAGAGGGVLLEAPQI